MQTNSSITFAPQLYIPSGVRDISFYEKAFGALELRRFENDDGTIHVSELSIGGTMFHLHEEKAQAGLVDPLKNRSTTVMIGLFVPDVVRFVKRAISAGAVEVTPVQDYDYGYRQGEIRDPFGHLWLIEMKI